MDRLWSPWRMEYIQADKAEPEDGRCVFCALLDGAQTDEPRVLTRGKHAFVTLAKYPYNPGHLLVLPTRHVGDIEELSVDENGAVAELLQRSVGALRAASAPHGFNVGLNLGHVAGAGLPDHLHWHVVPRWSGDTNFMPVVAATRVLPELLIETYTKLAPYFAGEGER
jgi:ATP adenylyltransferase